MAENNAPDAPSLLDRYLERWFFRYPIAALMLWGAWWIMTNPTEHQSAIVTIGAPAGLAIMALIVAYEFGILVAACLGLYIAWYFLKDIPHTYEPWIAAAVIFFVCAYEYEKAATLQAQRIFTLEVRVNWLEERLSEMNESRRHWE